MNQKILAGLVLIASAAAVGTVMLIKPAPVANVVESLSGKRIDVSDYAPGNQKYQSSGGSGIDKTVDLKVGEKITVVAPATVIKGQHRDENYDVMVATGNDVLTPEFINDRPSNEKTFKAIAGGKAQLDLCTHGTGLISSYYKIVVNVEGTPAAPSSATPSPVPGATP